MLVMLPCIFLFFIRMRKEDKIKAQFLQKMKEVQFGACFYCGAQNPQCVSKDEFWTSLKCPRCKKTTVIHFKGKSSYLDQ